MIRIITGGIGSGKSRRCLEEIRQLHEREPMARCLMLVNDHYSHETEKIFTEYFGGTGLNNIEVTTFRKLSSELLSEALMQSMTSSGRQMLLQKTVAQFLAKSPKISENLRRAIRQSGFLDVLSQMISEMKHYNISPEELYTSADAITDNNSLREKLLVIACMYEIYSENFAQMGYTDIEDGMDYLAEAIVHTNAFENTYMWIDRFDELLPQQMKVVEALYQKVKQLTVSVCYPQNELERPLYFEVERTLRKIEMLDSQREYIDCGEHLKNIKAPEIKFLLDKWDSALEYKDKANAIKIFESRDAYSEVEHAAGQIIDLVREENYRFRDIAVISGNEEDYQYLIDTIFEEYEIPVFTDTKIVLSDHPIAMQILSVFDIFENDFDYNSVFEYLKSGFIYEKTEDKKIKNLPVDAIDEIENFVLKYGIKYKSRWFADEDWTVGATISEITSDEEAVITEAVQRINELRRKITEPLRTYEAKSKGKISGTQHAKALFEFLEDIHLYEGLQKEIYALTLRDEITDADRFEQIWELILEVLDQLVITLGDTIMDREEFGQYIRMGISKCEIRIIPSGIDRVYVGTAERNAPADVKALFILGANDGTFPNDIKTEGFLSNADRQYIHSSKNQSITLAPDTRGRMEKRRYNVFTTVTAATERLYISFSARDIDGGQLGPSRLVADILRRFPQVHIEDDVNESTQNPGVYITSPKVTIHKLLKNKADNTKNPIWESVYLYFKEKDLYPHLLSMVDEGRYFARKFSTIPPEEAISLYGDGNIEYSASRLNVYAKCPYQYFMHYGLGLKEREVWEIGAGDVGTYAHSIIEGFCHAVEQGETDSTKKSELWNKLSEEKRTEILSELFANAEKKVESSSISQRGKVMHVMKRMERVIKNAAATVHSSLKNGKYSIAGEEQNISMQISENVSLKGIIDRLDICDGNGYNGIRVIDYKTGATVFNIVNILSGVDMQMVLYAAAAKEYYSQSDPSGQYRLTGIYYNHVRSDFQNQRLGKSDEYMKSAVDKVHRFDGMTFLENDDDLGVLYDMDDRLINDEESDFLSIKLTKAGKIHSNSKPLVKTFDEGEKLMDFVKNTAVKYDEEIRNGIIKQNPYVNDSFNTTCQYCEYSQICGIFENIEERRPEIQGRDSAEKLWSKKIGGEEV